MIFVVVSISVYEYGFGAISHRDDEHQPNSANISASMDPNLVETCPGTLHQGVAHRATRLLLHGI
jgi:hypothetical protein